MTMMMTGTMMMTRTTMMIKTERNRTQADACVLFHISVSGLAISIVFFY